MNNIQRELYKNGYYKDVMNVLESYTKYRGMYGASPYIDPETNDYSAEITGAAIARGAYLVINVIDGWWPLKVIEDNADYVYLSSFVDSEYEALSYNYTYSVIHGDAVTEDEIERIKTMYVLKNLLMYINEDDFSIEEELKRGTVC